MAKSPHSQCKGPRFNTWLRNWIPHVNKIPQATVKIPNVSANTRCKPKI